MLIDWHFAHDGWLFVAGVLCKARDRESRLVEHARAVFSTWTWIDHDAAAVGPTGRIDIPAGAALSCP